MSTSEERASKKAKTVDNEAVTSKHRTGTTVQVARVFFSYLVLLLYDVDHIPEVCISQKKSHVLVEYTRINYMTCSIRAAAAADCCFAALTPQPPKGKKPSRDVVHRD